MLAARVCMQSRPWVSIEDTVVPLAEAVVGAKPGANEVR